MAVFPMTFTNISPDRLQAISAQFALHLRSLGLSPFCQGDTSAGMEYELQVAVEGSAENVDLARIIRQSSFFKNTEKRAARGDLPQESVTALTSFLDHNDSGIWENSWVRMDEQCIGAFATTVLATDFLADKRYPEGPGRSDLKRFRISDHGKQLLRIPISYLLKLALAEILDPAHSLPDDLYQTGTRLLHHFQSDNTSPEILSLTIPSAKNGPIGQLAARETARTFLLIQLLTQYANTKFRLTATDQRAIVYNAPHAPYRQKKLNELVPDGYYRHLFMSPCLSGWERGEDKHKYMALCHQTLSRSQLNAISKLKDAGIITNNLVILPNTSNTCLANNGTHVSLGSTMLTTMAADHNSGFSPGVEKYLGDLVIKIVEHFLPLLVGTYTAAPYRIDFANFHPEKVLGFLPHELDYTHLRMLWRRWKTKADIHFLGKPLTPFGPHRLDTLLATVLRLHGDLIPDFRLIDYFITLLSTDTSPALNGIPGNQEQLKSELTEMGIFDNRMSIYLPYRMRAYEKMGYSGFEGRSYSLFPSFIKDMAEAVDLQNLITALAYKMVLQEKVLHQDIPDQPSIESERRQIFFAAAIGVPTVYIRSNTGNRFLREILALVKTQRNSKRYKNYIRVKIHDYLLALLEFLAQKGADLVEQMDLSNMLATLRLRLSDTKASAWGHLVKGATSHLKDIRPATKIPADTFNAATEIFYRNDLKKAQLQEGLTILAEDCSRLDSECNPLLQHIMRNIDQSQSVNGYLDKVGKSILMENGDPEEVRNLAHLILAVVHNETPTHKS